MLSRNWIWYSQRPTKLQPGWFGNKSFVSHIRPPHTVRLFNKVFFLFFSHSFFVCFLVSSRFKSRILHLAASIVELQPYCNLQKLQSLANIFASCIFVFILGRGWKFNFLFMVPFLLYFCLKWTGNFSILFVLL